MSTKGGIGPVNLIFAVPTGPAKQGLQELKDAAKDTMGELKSSIDTIIRGATWDAAIDAAIAKMRQHEQATSAMHSRMRSVAQSAFAEPFRPNVPAYPDAQQIGSILGISHEQAARMVAGVPQQMVPMPAMRPLAVPSITNVGSAGSAGSAGLAHALEQQRAALAVANDPEAKHLAAGGLPIYMPRSRPAYAPNFEQPETPSTYRLAWPENLNVQEQLAAQRAAADQASRERYEALKARVSERSDAYNPMTLDDRRTQLKRQYLKGGQAYDPSEAYQTQDRAAAHFNAELQNMRVAMVSLPDDKIRGIEKHFTRLVAEGKDFTRQLMAAQQVMKDLGLATARVDMPEAIPTPAQESSRPGGSGRRSGLGQGSDSRQFRYVSQNVAYGFEDAITSYAMVGGGSEGVRAAARAASNNISAFGTMFKNPLAGGTFIAGTAVAAAAAGPLAEAYERAFDRSTKAGERFRAELEHVNKVAREIAQVKFRLEDETSASGVMRTRQTLTREQKLNTDEFDRANARYAALQARMQNAGVNYASSPGSGPDIGLYHASPMSFSNPMSILDAFGANAAKLLSATTQKPSMWLEARDKSLAFQNELAEARKMAAEAGERQVATAKQLGMTKADEDRINRLDRFNEDQQRAQSVFSRTVGRNANLTPDETAKRINAFFDAQRLAIIGNKDFRGIEGETSILALEKQRRESLDQQVSAAKERLLEKTQKESETADDLSRKLRAEVDARQGIVDAYTKQRKDIEGMQTLDPKRRQELLAQSQAAQTAELKRYDEQQKKAKAPQMNILGSGIEVGSSADIEMRQRFSAARSGEADTAATQKNILKATEKSVDELKQLRKAVERGMPRQANLRRR